MDTHVTTTPDLDDRAGTPLGKPLGLPGARQAGPHHDGEQHPAEHEAVSADALPHDRPERLATSTPRKRGRRKALLATTAAVLVLAGFGAAGWTYRQQLAAFPYRATAAKLRDQSASLIASGPAAPSTPDDHVPMEVGTKTVAAPAIAAPAATAAATPARAPNSQEFKAALETSEFASFKLPQAATPAVSTAAKADPGKSEQAAPALEHPATANKQTATVTDPGIPAAPASTSAAPFAVKPGNGSGVTVFPAATPSPPTVDLTIISGAAEPPVAEVGATKPAALPPAVASALPAKPRDPVQVASELRAEPMAPKEIVRTAGLVRELGAQLQDMRLQVSQLNATVADLKELIDNRITEFDTRLSLTEAGSALALPAKPGSAQPIVSHASTTHAGTVAGRPAATPAGASSPTAPATRSVKDYRIQGASPGMVVLNVLNPAPGEAPALYLGLGDQVPGLGRLKSVQQRGTSWVAQTDAGLIQ